MSATLLARLRHWWNMPPRAARSIPATSLCLESLETRMVPSNLPAGLAPPSANQVFLATIYQGELKRPIESEGLSYWNSQLTQNNSRGQVVGAILNSTEYESREIKTDFNSLLGRDPDPSGLQAFLQALQQGATPQAVKATILGSEEFFSRVGGNSESFLNALYEEELGRAVDPSGRAS